MVRKNPKEYTTIEVKRDDFKKLSDYKVHKNQPMWEVIKKLIQWDRVIKSYHVSRVADVPTGLETFEEGGGE